MKYDDFKIFKFSTISKNINLIRDSYSRIYKKIKNITGNITDSLSYILKGIFSIIHKRTKTIPGNIVEFLSYISKYIFSGISKSIKFIIYNFLKIYKLIDLRRLDFKSVYKYFDITFENKNLEDFNIKSRKKKKVSLHKRMSRSRGGLFQSQSHSNLTSNGRVSLKSSL